MSKRAAARNRKQETTTKETKIAMNVATQQLMLPLLLAMDATKKGLLAFVAARRPLAGRWAAALGRPAGAVP